MRFFVYFLLSIVFAGASAQADVINSARQNLTSNECEALGGTTQTTTVNICASRKYCKRTGSDGTIFRVCIELNSTLVKPTGKPASNKPSLPTGPNAAASTANVLAVPLSKNECKALGGVVHPSASECKGLGQEACITTAPGGAIHVVCIDEVD
jgi:hypothetical protein